MQNLFLIEILSLTIQAECISNCSIKSNVFFLDSNLRLFFSVLFFTGLDVKSTEDKTRWNLSELCVFRNPWCKNSSDLPLSMQKYKTLFCWLLSDSWSGRSTFFPPSVIFNCRGSQKRKSWVRIRGMTCGDFCQHILLKFPSSNLTINLKYCKTPCE